jgi:hypothetical protein
MAFMDELRIAKCTWDIAKFEQHDVIGSGHDLVSELAPPKWSVRFIMRDLYNDAARKIAAYTRAVGNGPVLIYDPVISYPLLDPGGVILGGNTVQVNTLGSNGKSLSLKGLTNGYQLSAADKMQIVFASGTANYFFEASEDVTANGSGVTPEFAVWPPYPPIAVNATVILKKPQCKMTVVKQGFTPGQSEGNMTFGTTLELLEHV